MRKNIKKVFLGILLLMISISFIGCNATKTNNIIKKNGDKTLVSEDLEPRENSKYFYNSKEALVDADYVINELKQKGYDPKVVTATPKVYDKLFYPAQMDVLVNRGEISIYEYKINQKMQMTANYNDMYNYSYLFSQNQGNWVANFHLYRSGRVFVVYDGNDSNIIKSLNEIMSKEKNS